MMRLSIRCGAATITTFVAAGRSLRMYFVRRFPPTMQRGTACGRLAHEARHAPVMSNQLDVDHAEIIVFD
jgi:hypothetical protein